MASYVDIILREEVPYEDFKRWISGHPVTEESDSTQWKLQCSRCEFALSFLNHIRDQTSRILSNDGKRSKPSQLPVEQTVTQEETTVNNPRKCVPDVESKTAKKVLCSPDKSFGDSTSEERSPSHLKNKVHNVRRNSRDGALCGSNSSFDSPPISSSQHFYSNHLTKGSPKQTQHFESSPLFDLRVCSDSPGEKGHSKNPRENWNSKTSQNTTLWDFVSKENVLGARKKNSSENGGKDEKNQDKKCGSKVTSKQKRQRRINPTRVVKNVEGGENERSSSSQTERTPFGMPQEIPLPAAAFCCGAKETFERNSSTFAEERALLREERMKMQSSDHDVATSSPPKTSYVACKRSMEPELSLVTNQKELDTLVDIFTILINKNLVPNILSELCFLCNLLMVQVCDTQSVAQSSEDEESQHPGYFSTVHNCAYFAALTLSNQRNLLRLLDRNTQKMISENGRLARFVPVLSGSDDEGSSRRGIPYPQDFSVASNLTLFQTDVDNRKNFPTDRSFRMFCRQRDDFCEALRTWEGSRSMPGWSFSVVLGPRIRSILIPAHSAPEPTNYIHLARFFRAQLIANCGNGGVTGVDEPSSTGEVVPIALRDTDPSKLQRLQRRLVWPSRSRGGCCPLPTFPGAQEFFHDFIVYGANHLFNEHLKVGLISDILNLNDSQFIASELEDQDNKVDDDTRSQYIRCVLNMQLLAKFLGFLVFLPYQTESRLPDNIVLSYCNLRNKVLPVMDLIGLLKRAEQQKCLSVTVPWMVVFLSMIDRISSSIDYYRESFFPRLIAVYRNIDADKGQPVFTHAMFLIRLCLGWLFEQPNFPQEAVFTDKDPSPASDSSDVSGAANSMVVPQTKGPDDLDLIDEFAVYTICPFLSELRMIMADSSSGRTGTGTSVVRHITPVSAPDRLPALSSSRLLELKLEENFFSNQPASLRRTVDFVSERIASTCVRHICNQLLPKAMNRGLTRVHNSVLSKLKENSSNGSHSGQSAEKFELIMAREIHELSSEEWLNLKKECIEYSDKECERRALEAIPPLLPQSVDQKVSQAVCQMCVQVTCRTSRQKVRTWVTSHTSAALFTKEYEAEVGKLISSAQKPSEIKIKMLEEASNLSMEERPASQSENGDSLSAARVINHLRELILDIINSEPGTLVEFKTVQETIDNVTLSIQNGNSLTPTSLRTILSLTVDLAIFIVARGVKVDREMSSALRSWDLFLPLWSRLAPSSDEAFMRILSPRNLFLLSLEEDRGQCGIGKSTWATRLSSLLASLLSSKLLSTKHLEEQSLTVLHTAWPQEFLARYSECIKGVLDHPDVVHCSADDDDDDDINTSALLMEWLAESCATMEMLE